MIYTIGRDATDGRSAPGKVSARYGTPVTASLIVMAAALAGAAIFGWGMSAAPFDVFVWTSTIGTLLLLVVYLIVTAAAIKVLFFSGDSTVARWEIVVPVLAAVVLIYTLYKNIHPAGEPDWEPITALAWLVLALVALVVAPRVTTRLGQRLAADEGLTAPPADLAAPDALSRCRPPGGGPPAGRRAVPPAVQIEPQGYAPTRPD
jgi:amino acid transporter